METDYSIRHPKRYDTLFIELQALQAEVMQSGLDKSLIASFINSAIEIELIAQELRKLELIENKS